MEFEPVLVFISSPYIAHTPLYRVTETRYPFSDFFHSLYRYRTRVDEFIDLESALVGTPSKFFVR